MCSGVRFIACHVCINTHYCMHHNDMRLKSEHVKKKNYLVVIITVCPWFWWVRYIHYFRDQVKPSLGYRNVPTTTIWEVPFQIGWLHSAYLHWYSKHHCIWHLNIALVLHNYINWIKSTQVWVWDCYHHTQVKWWCNYMFNSNCYITKLILDASNACC